MTAHHFLNLRPVSRLSGRPQMEIAVVKGNGKSQRGSYGWIGEADGRCLSLLDRREMRKLRDALSKALGE